MIVERTQHFPNISGILIYKDNPITIGAWSFLSKFEVARFHELELQNPMEVMVFWVYDTRFTYDLIKRARLGEHATFSLPNDLDPILFCGSKSGRYVNKLSQIEHNQLNDYKFIENSEYVFFLEVIKMQNIGTYGLLICRVVDIKTKKDGHEWKHLL